jgi:hypothetical protein
MGVLRHPRQSVVRISEELQEELKRKYKFWLALNDEGAVLGTVGLLHPGRGGGRRHGPA